MIIDCNRTFPQMQISIDIKEKDLLKSLREMWIKSLGLPYSTFRKGFAWYETKYEGNHGREEAWYEVREMTHEEVEIDNAFNLLIKAAFV